MRRSYSAWRRLSPRTPVIAGVGVASQRVDEPGSGIDAIDLMMAAAREAAEESGTSAILGALGQVSVPAGSWTHRNPGRELGRRLGAPDARSVLMTPGIPQQTLFNHAYRSILDGSLDVALVVGGEAAHRAAVARRAGVTIDDPVFDGTPDEHHSPKGEIVAPVEIAAKVFSPVEVFALIDNARRVAEQMTIAEHRDDIAALWAEFSATAAGNEDAWYRDARSAAWLRDPSADNRAMAFPYNKWHCSQMNVDQAAAVLVCSLEAAERLGVDPDAIVFPLVALESSWTLAMVRRRELHRWPAMHALGRAAEGHLGRPLAGLDHLEVYSCFPAAVRVQQSELGLPLDRTPTITGGEPFAGGPWNNFVLQATAAMIRRLRTHPGDPGLVTTVSGFLHKPGLAVYATEPERPLLLADLATDAEAATATAPVADDYTGPATVIAYTVSEQRPGRRVVVVAETPSGARTVAARVDDDLARQVTVDEFIGHQIHADGAEFTT